MLEKTKISNFLFILAKVMLLVRVGGNLSNTKKKKGNKTCYFPDVTILLHTVVSLPYQLFQPVFLSWEKIIITKKNPSIG